MTAAAQEPVPLRLHAETVPPEWVDYNGHMNVAFYVLAFDHATDALLDHLDLGAAYRQRENKSVFVVETHVNYLNEVLQGARLLFDTIVLDADAKRLHFCHEMRIDGGDGGPVAVTELMSVHVDLESRGTAAFPETQAARLAALVEAQGQVPRSRFLGRRMGIKRG